MEDDLERSEDTWTENLARCLQKALPDVFEYDLRIEGTESIRISSAGIPTGEVGRLKIRSASVPHAYIKLNLLRGLARFFAQFGFLYFKIVDSDGDVQCVSAPNGQTYQLLCALEESGDPWWGNEPTEYLLSTHSIPSVEGKTIVRLD